MRPYLDLVARVLDDGDDVPTRATLRSTGQRVHARSLLGAQASYRLCAGFPLVTTKRIPFRHVAAELCWYLSGVTNVRPLQDQGITIWDEWADPAGNLGPVYGKQWRSWGDDGWDQVTDVVRRIRAVKATPGHPCGRRILLLSYNPADERLATGPLGCHTLAQFHVRNGWLSCNLYQRSGDLFLGVPWNVACYALLTHALAYACDLRPKQLIHTIGDAHVYDNHREPVREQLTREPRALPELAIKVASREEMAQKILRGTLTADDFQIHGYRPHPRLSGEVAV